MRKILLQNVSTSETKEVTKAVALSDKDEYDIIRLDISVLKQHRNDLLYGAVPVGSVEFCREAMKVLGIKEPNIDPYPLLSWIPYYRIISKLPAILAMGTRMFIKPTKLKRFNGFVYDPNVHAMALDEHDREQLKCFMKIPDNEEVFISEVVDFASEFRYYIDNGEIKGFARYDASDEEGEHLTPDISVVKEFVGRLNKPHPYVLDFGVLKTGETALVEYNHFWAIGIYPDAISSKEYLDMLIKCWDYIRSK